jgi:hypothetical protein
MYTAHPGIRKIFIIEAHHDFIIGTEIVRETFDCQACAIRFRAELCTPEGNKPFALCTCTLLVILFADTCTRFVAG